MGGDMPEFKVGDTIIKHQQVDGREQRHAGFIPAVGTLAVVTKNYGVPVFEAYCIAYGGKLNIHQTCQNWKHVDP